MVCLFSRLPFSSVISDVRLTLIECYGSGRTIKKGVSLNVSTTSFTVQSLTRPSDRMRPPTGPSLGMG
jgi:hypothetical protein